MASAGSELQLKRGNSIFMVTIMILSTLVAGIPNVAAATGNEAVSLSSVTSSSASVDVANLDGNDSYYWWTFIYYPSGLLYGFDYGSISGVSGNASYNATWTTPTTNGTYSVNCELTDFIGLSLSNTTSQFIVGSGNGTVLTPTAALSNLNTTSVTLDITNLDSNNSYYWWAWVFGPSGSTWYSSGYRSISGINSGTYYPVWTDPYTNMGANGTYTVVGEIRASNQTILHSDTKYFSIGSGLTGNEVLTASNITHVGATVTGANLSSSEVYQWSVFTYFPSGSLHNTDSGIWNSPSTSTMTASAAWSPGNFQGNYAVSFRLYEYWNQTLLDTWNSSFYHVGTTNLTPDQYEPDDSVTTATSIQVNSTTAANIHNAGQDDYFSLNLTSGSMNFVNLSFLHSTADLQLNVYYTNSIGNNILIDYSHSATHNEQIVFNLTANRTIIIWVFSSGGTSWYNLSVHSTGTPPPPTAVGDVNEPNDSFATATAISSPSSQSSLTIHNASDDDFFSINATAGTTYWVNISFTHSQGDLDMDLYDSSQSQVDWSAGTGNSESVTYTPTTNQTLYAQVYGWAGATNTYSVTFGGLSTGSGGGSPTSPSGPPGAGSTNATILNTTYLSGSHAYDDLYIGCGIVSPCGSIVATGDLILTVNTLTVAAGGSIIAQDNATNTQGVGNDAQLSSSWRGDGAGGAGHYGSGGDGGGTTSNGGSSYGVGNETGSNGGAVYDNAGNLVSASGQGGGRIIIYADTIVIYGTVSASGYDGDPGYRNNNGSGTGGPGAGGGSGGSIVMRANSVTIGGSSGGSVLAQGGSGGDGADGDCLPGTPCLFMYDGGDGGGGGSAGNIDIRASSASNLNISSSSTLSVTGGSGGMAGARYGTGVNGSAGYSGSTGNVTTGTWSGWSGSAPSGTGTEWVTVTGVTSTNGAYSWGNLSANSYYEIDWYWTYWNGTAHTIVQQGTYVPSSTTGNTNQAHSSPSVGGTWCFTAQVWEQVGTTWNMSADDIDCMYHEILYVNHTSDTSGWIRSSNLTAGASYTVDWYITDGNITTAYDQGNYSFMVATSVHNQTINFTNNGGGIPHCILADIWDSSGNLIDEVWDCWTTAVLPPASGNLWVNTMNDTASQIEASNLSAGTNYQIAAQYTYWNGSAHTFLGSVQDNFTGSNTGNHLLNLTLTTYEMGGTYCIIGDLYDMDHSLAGTLIDSDIYCRERLFVQPTVTSDTTGTVLLTNLTTGNTYDVDWYLLEGPNGATLDSGTYQVTLFTGTSHSQSVSWAPPTTRTEKCFYVELYDSNGTLVDADIDCFIPTLPDIEVTNLTNGSVTWSAYNLTSGSVYLQKVRFYGFANNTTHFDSGWSAFNATSGTANGNESWTVPGLSGYYCVEVKLTLIVAGGIMDTDVDCITIIHDADNDGVWDQNDLCPNTPNGATVDQNGCADSQRDTDGDGYTDDIDDFVNDSTQWNDADGDGYGDNASGNNGDAFPLDATQWSDADGDGCGDNPNGTNGDQFPFDPTQCSDQDGDGYGDNPNGTNPDAFPTDPTQWSDVDGDGYGDDPAGNNPDAFPTDSTQWSDSDGDGYGDNPNGNNPDLWPNDGTQWADTDGDGYGDNPNGTAGDDFPNDPSQWADSDDDGWGDNASGTNPDAFPQDGTQWADKDGDGCGDNPEGNNADQWPDDPTQCTDSDGDGYGDNASGTNPDAFPNDSSQWADSDGDGWGDNPSGNNSDAFPNEYTQQQDSDGDGYGDNPTGVNPDHCPNSPPGAIVDSNGCAASELDDDNDGVTNDNDTCPNTPGGEVADAIGCSDSQKDADMDGVSDALDICPGSPQGEEIDGYGCAASQRDTDNDGIKDHLDQCPASPPGATVNGYGCADSEWDSDEDGIFDADDLCPYTSTLDVADSTGCGAAQRDTDEDGVMDADDLCPMTMPGYNANMNGCDSTQLDGDDDGVNDATDTVCPNSPAGEAVDETGCADSELDDDNDGVTNDLDQCELTLSIWTPRTDGCSPEQADTDGDGVMDDRDVCADTPSPESVNSVGCSLTQIDSDGDGVNDAQDAFPNDPNEVSDSDGDGIGDVADFYPNDAARSAEEQGSFMPYWIALIIVVFLGIAGVALFIMRRSGREEEDQYAGGLGIEAQPAENLYAMAGVTEVVSSDTPQVISDLDIRDEFAAETPSTEPTIEWDANVTQAWSVPAHATTNEHGQTLWADEAGVSWCQDPDGSLKRYDAESGTWVPHQ